MREIVVNLLLVGVWIGLSAGLARLIFVFSESTPIGGATAVILWLVGQLVILSPLIRIIWRDRAVGAKTKG